jgi:hypothetical protein
MVALLNVFGCVHEVPLVESRTTVGPKTLMLCAAAYGCGPSSREEETTTRETRTTFFAITFPYLSGTDGKNFAAIEPGNRVFYVDPKTKLRGGS